MGVVFLQPASLSNWKVKSKDNVLEKGRRLTIGTGTSVCMRREVSCPGMSGMEPMKALLTFTCMLEIGPMGTEL